VSHISGSSLERHNQEMKVGGFARWLFGDQGGTQLPTPEVEHPHSHHDAPEVSEEFKSFFKDAPADTDAEYQTIRRDRTIQADLANINIPAGYVPVTFVEDDVIVIAEKGANLRHICLENNIPLYSDVAKLINCRGLGLCTTCRVQADPNSGLSEPTKMEKVHLIRDNPKYRLACQCSVEDAVKISTKPAREYGMVMRHVVRNSALFGVFSLIMLLLLLVMGFDIVGVWF
jgi:ferredoxin